MTMTIDRFEGDYAVLEIREETGEVLYKNLPASWLPDDAAEGDYNADYKCYDCFHFVIFKCL